jgi:hypothetical protein
METRKVLEAIALQKCLSAIYNGGTVRLAPHIMYTRHGEIYVDATTLDRNGARPREIKLGTFKLVGLKDLEVTDDAFVPEPVFDPRDAKYADVTLLSVDTPFAESD